MRARALVACALVGLPLSAASASPLPLPRPDAAAAQSTTLLGTVGAQPDRRLRSTVPGPVVNDEVVRVGLDGSGRPAQVQLDQRLRLTGTGDYVVRERGPARSATTLGQDPPPITKLGAVVWQGFCPGSRDLRARLVLDAGLEAPRQPLSVTLSFTPAAGGPPQPLGAGGVVPGAGTVQVGLANATVQPADLPTAAALPAASLRQVAVGLDSARRAALAAPGRRLPAAAAGLPATVEVTGPATVPGVRAVPLRVTGTVTATGAPAMVAGPGTSAVPGGASVAGTLSGQVALVVRTAGAAVLHLDLQAVPTLDARALVPFDGAPSWSAWAARGPVARQRRDALDLLVQAAASGARAGAYSPYLGADLPGRGTTAFRYALAPAAAVAVAVAPLRPRPGPLALVGVAALLVLLGGAGLWRVS